MTYMRIPKESIEVIYKLETLQKVNIQKSAVFLYPNSKLLKKKLIEQSIYNSTKRTKFLGINLTKEVKDLYSENYKH